MLEEPGTTQKKMIEEEGRKGTDAHKAAVVGDTVGDPFKDTSGPSLNILLKLMSVVALVIAPSIAMSSDTITAYNDKSVSDEIHMVEAVEVENDMNESDDYAQSVVQDQESANDADLVEKIEEVNIENKVEIDQALK